MINDDSSWIGRESSLSALDNAAVTSNSTASRRLLSLAWYRQLSVGSQIAHIHRHRHTLTQSATFSNDTGSTSTTVFLPLDGYFSLPCPENYCYANFTCRNNVLPWWNNPLCAHCIDGYTDMGGVCTECTQSNGGFVFLVILVIFVMAIVNLVLNSSEGDGTIGIVLYFLQTGMFMMGPFTRWLQWTNLFTFDPEAASSGVCIIPLSPVQQFHFKMLFPVIYLGASLVLMVVHKLIAWYRQGSPIVNGQADQYFLVKSYFLVVRVVSTFNSRTFNTYCRGLCAIYLFGFTQITSVAIAYVHCVDISDGKSVVFSSPTIDCDSDEFKFYLPLVIVALLIVMLSPFAMFWWLYRHRIVIYRSVMNFDPARLSKDPQGELDPHGEPSLLRHLRQYSCCAGERIDCGGANGQQQSLPILDRDHPDSVWVQRYGVMFDAYKPFHFGWGCWILFRRFLFVIVDAAFLSMPRAKTVAFAYLNILSLCLQIWQRPFRDKRTKSKNWTVLADYVLSDNMLEVTSLLVLCLLSTFIAAYQSPYETNEEVIIFLLIGFPFLLMSVDIGVVKINAFMMEKDHSNDQKNGDEHASAANDHTDNSTNSAEAENLLKALDVKEQVNDSNFDNNNGHVDSNNDRSESVSQSPFVDSVTSVVATQQPERATKTKKNNKEKKKSTAKAATSTAKTIGAEKKKNVVFPV
jgi:hypothetical protein